MKRKNATTIKTKEKKLYAQDQVECVHVQNHGTPIISGSSGDDGTMDRWNVHVYYEVNSEHNWLNDPVMEGDNYEELLYPFRACKYI